MEEEHEEDRYTCEMCQDPIDGAILHYCDMCRSTYCDRCWDKMPPHKRKDKEHEKTKHGVARKVREALSPPSDEVSQEQRFNSDAMSAWFGLSLCF
jgi:ribosome-binding protein aMBF1 (putative translation factor)